MPTFASLSPSQRRMVAAGKIDKLCTLIVKGSADPLIVEVIGLATPADAYPDLLRSNLVARHYYAQDLLTLPLTLIERLEERPWPVSDHRHPDWQEPGRIVRPAKQ